MDLKVTKVFEKNYSALNDSTKRFIINVGGTRSSKTWSLAQLMIVYCLSNPKKVVSIVRKSFPSLRSTVMRDVITVLKEMGLYSEKQHNKTEHIFVFPNGSQMEFFSVDDEQKIRGRKRDILYANEANELSFEEFQQLNFRTNEKVFFDFNPSDLYHWIYDLYNRPETIKIHSTYKDNPFLPKALINEIEGLINVDENYYRIYALGESAVPKSTIFTHQRFINKFPDESLFTNEVYGIDFGYNHPTAIVKASIIENKLYVQEKLYESHLTTNDLILKMKSIPIEKNIPIVCDSARPEVIKELQRAGYNAQMANKNVKEGIDAVKSMELYISDDSINLQKEINQYKWKVIGDKVIDEPVKLHDDAVDAMRYAVQYLKKYQKKGLTSSFTSFSL
jgi:phage terminase large subunit